MRNFLYLYQHIPERLSPVAFSFGPFHIEWYALMYLVGFGVAYLLIKYRIIENQRSKVKCQNFNSKVKSLNTIQDTSYQILDTSMLLSLLVYIFIGLLIGARIGYVLFYNLPYYWHYPSAIISPFDPITHQYIGIYGMSYHGGLIGALIASYVFTKKQKIDFWSLANFIAPVIPAAYFFGRIGNFLNGELWGRITGKPWGMYFPGGGPYLRHPSQLYEAVLEGLAIFVILWSLQNSHKFKNNLFVLYIFLYAAARYICEFFRQPDPQIGFILGIFTLGQILSLIMVLAAIMLWLGKKKNAII